MFCILCIHSFLCCAICSSLRTISIIHIFIHIDCELLSPLIQVSRPSVVKYIESSIMHQWELQSNAAAAADSIIIIVHRPSLLTTHSYVYIISMVCIIILV